MHRNSTTPCPDPVVRLVDVSKRFGDTVALDHVDLDVPTGLVTGLLGPNGAGKTTLIGLLTGLRRPDGGRVEVFGGDPRVARNRLRLGTTPQETGLPAALRVGETVRFVARHFPDPVEPDVLLERFGLAGLARRQTGGLSGGQRRRLAVALAFAGRPRLVVLDEPTTGLDVTARRALWDSIRAYVDDVGGTVLLSSHHLEEIETLAGRTVVLHRGRVVASGDTESVRAQVARSTVSYRGPVPPPVPGVSALGRDGDRHVVHTTDADELVRALVREGTPFTDLRVVGASLEDAFLALTSEVPVHDKPLSAVGGAR